MGLFGFRQSSAVCFFCNQKSALAPGESPHHWYCRQCLNHNDFDQNGEMIPREEWYDESLNTDIQKSVSTHHPKQQTTDPVFCDVCITNQRLVTSLLANFVPEDDHPDFLSKDAQVEDYRHRLYQRYPISCEQCQRTVDKKLYHQLHRLKSLLLHANAKRQRMVNSATSSNVFREDTPVIVALSCWIASWIPFCIICSVVGFHALKLLEQYYSLIIYEFPTYIFPALYLSSLVVPFLNPLWNLRRNQPHLSSQLKRIRVQHFVIMWIISVIRISLFYISTNAYSSKKVLLCHVSAVVAEFIGATIIRLVLNQTKFLNLKKVGTRFVLNEKKNMLGLNVNQDESDLTMSTSTPLSSALHPDVHRPEEILTGLSLSNTSRPSLRGADQCSQPNTPFYTPSQTPKAIPNIFRVPAIPDPNKKKPIPWSIGASAKLGSFGSSNQFSGRMDVNPENVNQFSWPKGFGITHSADVRLQHENRSGLFRGSFSKPASPVSVTPNPYQPSFSTSTPYRTFSNTKALPKSLAEYSKHPSPSLTTSNFQPSSFSSTSNTPSRSLSRSNSAYSGLSMLSPSRMLTAISNKYLTGNPRSQTYDDDEEDDDHALDDTGFDDDDDLVLRESIVSGLGVGGSNGRVSGGIAVRRNQSRDEGYPSFGQDNLMKVSRLEKQKLTGLENAFSSGLTLEEEQLSSSDSYKSKTSTACLSIKVLVASIVIPLVCFCVYILISSQLNSKPCCWPFSSTLDFHEVVGRAYEYLAHDSVVGILERTGEMVRSSWGAAGNGSYVIL